MRLHPSGCIRENAPTSDGGSGRFTRRQPWDAHTGTATNAAKTRGQEKLLVGR